MAGDYVMLPDGGVKETPTGRVYYPSDNSYGYYRSRVDWGSAYVPSVTDSLQLQAAGRNDVAVALIERAKAWRAQPDWSAVRLNPNVGPESQAQATGVLTTRYTTVGLLALGGVLVLVMAWRMTR